jgi:hypothetical protein
MIQQMQAEVLWRKSTASGASGDCVEVAVTARHVLVRDSKLSSGSVLSFTHREWRAFLTAVRAYRNVN